MNVKFWKGWLTPQTVQETNWHTKWEKSVSESENENCELHVFKIPKSKSGIANPEAIYQIEALLQSKF